MKPSCLPNLTHGTSAALLLFAAFAGLNTGSASATAMNNPPPVGAILDLGGSETGTAAQTINHGSAVTESVSFTGGVTSTNITFAFREDPAYISFSNVMLVDTTNPSGNLITNGDFSSGSGNNATNWSFVNVYGAAASGVVSSSCGGGFATCWFDGSVQAYDAITQVVGTTIGDNYTLSFGYSDDGGYTNFSDISTNGNVTGTGGNGVDILAYAQAGIPAASATPEPQSLALTANGLFGALGVWRRRRSAA